MITFSTLSEICFIHGGNPSPKDGEFSINGIPFVKMKDLGKYHHTSCLLNTENNVNESIISNKRLKVIPKGSILLPRSGSVAQNHRAILGQDSVIVSHICALEIKENNKVFNKYLYYYLTTIDMVKITKKTTGLDAITFEDLGKIEIPLVPLKTQKRIADILDAADALRQKDQELLKRYDELAQAIFIDLFGDPLKNELGWDEIPLESVCLKITDGTHQSPQFKNTGIPFLLVSNIENNRINYNTKKFISEEDFEILNKRTPIEIGNILLTTVGSYGNPAIILNESPFAFQRHIAFIKPNHKLVNFTYLYGMLLSPLVKNQIDKLVNGVAQKTLNLSDLKRLKIWNPPLESQLLYSKKLNNIESGVIKMDSQISTVLFNSLLQKAFNGELVN